MGIKLSLSEKVPSYVNQVVFPWAGVIMSALSAIVVGSIWYSPWVFGAQWQKMIGLSDKDMKKRATTALAWLIPASFLTAYVLAHFIMAAHGYYHGTWMNDSLQTAFWAWVGFGLTTVVAHGVFEPRDRLVMAINAGNRLATLLIMGLILGVSFS
jgi:uncharacterized membrane protein